MPYETRYVLPETVLTHNGTPVYRCYENNNFDEPERYVFSIVRHDCETGSVNAFDVRLFNTPSARRLITDQPSPFDQHRWRKLRLPSPKAYLSHPEYALIQAEHHTWFNVTEPALILAALAEAVDLNLFTT